MIRRTTTPGNDYYERGIRVCDEWTNNYDAWLKWAENNGYASDLSIDRIDNNKGYSPDNCRWATAAEQQRNRRDNILINGKILIDYLREIGRDKDYDTIRYRISTMHWPIMKAINTPIQHKGGVV